MSDKKTRSEKLQPEFNPPSGEWLKRASHVTVRLPDLGVQPLDLPFVRGLRVPRHARVEGARRLILKLLLPKRKSGSDGPRRAAQGR